MPKRAKTSDKGFARRLAIAREHAGFKDQKSMAMALGIEAETYRTYERGTEPRFDVLIRISDLTKTSLDWLIAERLPPGAKTEPDSKAVPLSAAKAKRAV